MKRRGKFQKQAEEIEQQKELGEASSPKIETKEEIEKRHFDNQMENVDKILKYHSMGFSVISIQWKVMLAPTYIEEVIKLGRGGMKEYWRKIYGNPNLGKAPEKVPLETGLFKF